MSLETAAIIAIGSEMLGPSRLDTNSLKITTALEDFGIAVVRKSIVGDRLHDLVDEIRFSLEHADLLFVTGGLGPTKDDLTREALSEALDLSMEVDQQIIERLEARFAARGWKMPESNKRQANVFRGQTTLIFNKVGENWLIGGSGNDILTGAGGNDIIIGGSIRLDAA